MITALWFKHWPEGSSMFNVCKLFWLDTECNLPTLYQTFALLLSAGLLAVISFIVAMEKENYVFHWKLMSVVFLFLGIDENAQIHEVILEMFSQSLQGNLLLQNKTLITLVCRLPLILGVTFFAFTYMRFLLHLPRRTRWLFILSGVIYVGGALGLEMVSHAYANVHGKHNPIYGGLATVEEFMEMIGIATFLYALLDYLSRRSAEIRIHFKSAPNHKK